MINIDFSFDIDIIIKEILANKNMSLYPNMYILKDIIASIYDKYSDLEEAKFMVCSNDIFNNELNRVGRYQEYLIHLIRNTLYYQRHLLNHILRLPTLSKPVVGVVIPREADKSMYLGNNKFILGVLHSNNIVCVYHEFMHSVLEYNNIKLLKELKKELISNPNNLTLNCELELIMDINHAIIEFITDYQLSNIITGAKGFNLDNIGHDETYDCRRILLNDWMDYINNGNSNIYEFRDKSIEKVLRHEY